MKHQSSESPSPHTFIPLKASRSTLQRHTHLRPDFYYYLRLPPQASPPFPRPPPPRPVSLTAPRRYTPNRKKLLTTRLRSQDTTTSDELSPLFISGDIYSAASWCLPLHEDLSCLGKHILQAHTHCLSPFIFLCAFQGSPTHRGVAKPIYIEGTLAYEAFLIHSGHPPSPDLISPRSATHERGR